MARPNLSVRTMALVMGRSSLMVGCPILGLVDNHRPTAYWGGDTSRRNDSSKPFPFQWLLAKPGGAGVSALHPREQCGAGALARVLSPSPPKPRYAEGQGGRKLVFIID